MSEVIRTSGPARDSMTLRGSLIVFSPSFLQENGRIELRTYLACG